MVLKEFPIYKGFIITNIMGLQIMAGFDRIPIYLMPGLKQNCALSKKKNCYFAHILTVYFVYVCVCVRAFSVIISS